MKLPIDDVVPAIVEGLDARGALVLQAPPGAGKTTRVPAAFLERVAGKVLVLEPRRIAARMAARRVAEELGEEVGRRVGYEVRFERVASKETRVEYVTEGIFTRRAVGDPMLGGVDVVVLDEVHERHLQTDLALAWVRALRREKRPDLRVIAMSATLDQEALARFLDAAIVSSEGRRFEVATEYLDRPDDRPLEKQVVSAVRRLCDEGLDGDVLVFLPGAAEIRRATEACAAIAKQFDLMVVQLHGDLPPAAQDRAIAKGDRRKVILSTNVAETSVTIEGVVAVIDSGLARVATHDPWSGRSSLDVAKIARASATQRAGRAGRTRPGRCLRLYTKGDHDARPEHDSPEIARADLAEPLLQLEALGVRDIAWLTPPSTNAIEGARALLRSLGAIDDAGVTAIGKKMTRIPASPRLARVVVEGDARGVGERACGAAAILGEGRPLGRSSGIRSGESDVIAALDLLDEVRSANGVDGDRARHAGVDFGAASSIERARRQLLRFVANGDRGDDRDLSLALLTGFPDRVARRREGKEGRLGVARELVLSNGGSATLDESSVVTTAPWMIALEARVSNGRARVSFAHAIEPEMLLEDFADAIEEKVDVTWNEAQERVEAMERMRYGALVLDQRPAGASASRAIAELLAEKAIAAGLGAFLDDREALDRLAARARFVIATAPDLADNAGVRAIDDAAMKAIVIARCEGKKSFQELRRGDGSTFLDDARAFLGHATAARLDVLAPETITLPGGRRTKVEYAEGQPPAIASRLQDFFGMKETPRVLEGRVAVVVHLLAPNGRDVQVTTDLAGFWSKHYPALRNALMRRYPRHAWPDDPLHATPPAPRR